MLLIRKNSNHSHKSHHLLLPILGARIVEGLWSREVGQLNAPQILLSGQGHLAQLRLVHLLHLLAGLAGGVPGEHPDTAVIGGCGDVP